MSRTVVALIVALTAAAGCSDPVISVEVVVPTEPRDYASALTSIAISVLAPEDDAFDCDAVAFGEIDADTIALAEVTGVTVMLPERAAAGITGVPRLGRKLWVAEGRNPMGLPVIAGCTEQLDIEDDTTVVIVTEPSGQLLVDPHRADLPLPARLGVQLDDGSMDPLPLPGREVRWEIYGPHSAHVDSGAGAPAITDDDGNVTLELEPPDAWGPASLQVRARWARNQPAVIPGFGPIAPVNLSINGTCTGLTTDTLEVDNASWQRFRLDDSLAMAGLAIDATRTRLYVAAWDGSAAVDVCSPDLPDLTTFTVLRAETADPEDRLLGMTATLWLETVVNHGGTGLTLAPRPPVTWTADPSAGPPVAIVTMRACMRDDGSNDYVLAQFADDTVRAFDTDGVAIASPFADQLEAKLPAIAMALSLGPLQLRMAQGGCVAQGPGQPPLQALLVGAVRAAEDGGALPRFLVVDDPGDHFAAVPTISFGAVAFSDPRQAEPVLLGGALDPSGAKVVRWQLTDGDDGLELREVQRDDSLGPPASVALGNLDGDEHPDTVWGLLDAVQGGVPESRLQVSLGCGAGDLALNSITTPLSSPGAAVFLAAQGELAADIAVGTSRQALFFDLATPEAP